MSGQLQSTSIRVMHRQKLFGILLHHFIYLLKHSFVNSINKYLIISNPEPQFMKMIDGEWSIDLAEGAQ
jgi:hypothetical protein